MTRFVLLPAIALTLAAVPALADDAAVSVVRSQFTDHIEDRKPVGDGSALAGQPTATYWVEVSNTKAPTEVTLVWTIDDKETVRQTLDVGTSPRWRTWGSCSIRKAHNVKVEVLDKDGASLRTDSLKLDAG